MNDRRKQIIQGVIAIVFSGLYLINPTGGIIEFIPDVIPIAGNIDEAGAVLILLWGLNNVRPGSTQFLDNEQSNPGNFSD
jgi:uncharacterized membrane protein YkvA (DUF1232 family)